MPELAPDAHTPTALAAAPVGYVVPGRSLPGFGGLEVLSPAERYSWGVRYGIDTPRYFYPLGFGEWGDVLPGQSARYIIPAEADTELFCAELFGGENPLP